MAGLPKARLVLASFFLLESIAQAQVRWTPGTEARVQKYAEDIRTAAESWGVEPGLLAAIAVQETGMRPIRGGTRDEMWGPCQVHWRTWGWLLRWLSIAERPRDLLQAAVGLDAGAAVLSYQRARWGRPWQLTVCLYSSGVQALRFERDCRYSRAVWAMLPAARRAMEVRP